MCYPCEHCGACKVHIDPQVCPMCGASIDGPGEACPECGFVMPLPPGATKNNKANESSSNSNDSGKGGIMVDKNVPDSEDKNAASGDKNVIPRSVDGGYEPEIVADNDLPLADTFGVVGTWPVAKDRPKL